MRKNQLFPGSRLGFAEIHEIVDLRLLRLEPLVQNFGVIPVKPYVLLIVLVERRGEEQLSDDLARQLCDCVDFCLLGFECHKRRRRHHRLVKHFQPCHVVLCPV